MTHPRTTLSSVFALTLLVFGAPAQAQITSEDMRFFSPREIGPAVTGGRIHDIEAMPHDPSVVFVASASGGLWKSDNRGHTWRNVSDGWFNTSTFGDVAIAPSNPDIVYAGTGEQNNRQSTSWGDGVYRSDDGGETWRHLGLVETRHIGKVEVDPRDPDVVFVAAQGNLWAGSEDRGVYRTRNGGESWERVLFIDEYSGAVDLVMDSSNPDIVYAAIYPRMRKTWGFNGGAESGGIFKSTDGGDSWRELTEGIPEGGTGRIGLAISASNPMVLNAVIEHEDRSAQGTYRSEDGGESWERVNSLNPRPMFYSEIFIDPTDENTVYVLGTSSSRSRDGGRSFEEIADEHGYDVGIHRDHHALWINPTDPDHFYFGTDGGLYETYDGGDNLRKVNNFGIGQFYGIGVDMRDPYWVYGGMQDNHSWMAPNETRRWVGIINDDWQQTGFSDGIFQRPDPTDVRYVYANSFNGRAYRFDANTGETIPIQPQAPEGESYRWDWASPILISPHDPATVYLAAQRLFISNDRGLSFRRTEDLTRNIDPDDRMIIDRPQGEVAISPNEGPGGYGQITAIAESPVTAGVLWVGADDGALQLSRDGGETWTPVHDNVPSGIAEAYVSRIVASVEGAGVAYVTIDNHRDGDFAPYVYRTEDYGASWTSVVGNLPTGSINAMAEHPDNPDLLFVGTEHGLFASTDRGGSWARVPGTPTTAYDDIVIHPRDNDLVAGTHGRGIWIVDDLQPLVEWTPEVMADEAHVFDIPKGRMFHYWKDTSYRGDAEYAGENPPDGTTITYRLGSAHDEARISVTNEAGRVVWDKQVPSDAGTHRINWNLQWEGRQDSDVWEPHIVANRNNALNRTLGPFGVWVSPGTYTVTLSAGGHTATNTVLVEGDPELPHITQADYELRERSLIGLQDMAERARQANPDLSCGGRFGRRGPALEGDDAVLCDVQQTARRIVGSLTRGGVRGGAMYPPTPDQLARIEELRAALDRVLGGN